MSLTIIVPVYNERERIADFWEILKGVLSNNRDVDVVIVDDGSVDGTREYLKQKVDLVKKVNLVYMERNAGKGSAVSRGLSLAKGEYVGIQDADLEYNTLDLIRAYKHAKINNLSVVYGSRNIGNNKYHYPLFYLGSQVLCGLFNLLYGTNLTDVETCHKLFRRSEIKFDLTEKGFGLEIELTAKLVSGGNKIVEIPISYNPRRFEEGKKITWKDGVVAIWLVFRYRIFR